MWTLSALRNVRQAMSPVFMTAGKLKVYNKWLLHLPSCIYSNILKSSGFNWPFTKTADGKLKRKKLLNHQITCQSALQTGRQRGRQTDWWTDGLTDVSTDDRLIDSPDQEWTNKPITHRNILK